MAFLMKFDRGGWGCECPGADCCLVGRFAFDGGCGGPKHSL